jgi:XTP/dITP diphosphohydrolase
MSASSCLLILATRNAHKVGEIRSILGPEFRYADLNRYPGAPTVVEDAPTFAGNAAKKASELAAWLATHARPPAAPAFVLADDSGLEVDALAGAPGVHSARFAAIDQASAAAAGNSADADNNAKLLRLLREVPMDKRTARFRCVIAFVAVKSEESDLEEVVPRLFEGACEGRIGIAPRGQGGFGYDPLFIPTGYDQTFAELGEATKNGLSHRARALEKLRKSLRV